MKKITFLSIVALSFVIGAAAACSSGSNTTTTTATNNDQTRMTNTVAANNAPTKTEDDTPASIKAAFPDAQSFTKQHKDIPKDAIADIEKDTGAKLPDTDYHSYLAFSTDGGARKQIGAATLVKFSPDNSSFDDLVVIYESKNGEPVIKQIQYAEQSSVGHIIATRKFLEQFAGKGHDDKFQIGADLKASPIDDATAKAIAKAAQIDAITMQNLYGAAHAH